MFKLLCNNYIIIHPFRANLYVQFADYLTRWKLSTRDFFLLTRGTDKMSAESREFSASINNPVLFYSVLYDSKHIVLKHDFLRRLPKLYESLFFRYEISDLKIRTIHKRNS